MRVIHGIHSRDDEDCSYLLGGGVDGAGCSGATAEHVIRVPGNDRIPGRGGVRFHGSVRVLGT